MVPARFLLCAFLLTSMIAHASGPIGGPVTATVETSPARGERDDADDAAIWVHPEDAALSLVIGTNKHPRAGGLQVFGLDGRERQFLAVGGLNNVDLRDGFPLAGEEVSLVGASNRTSDTIDFFGIDSEAQKLRRVGRIVPGRARVYGFCMYRSPVSDRFYAVVTYETGAMEQFRLAAEDGAVSGTRVRAWRLATTAEGCAADDAAGDLYVAEEMRGLWKYGAEPVAGSTRVLVDHTGDGGHLVSDVEGVALYQLGAGTGYVVVSSQGSDSFVVYQRTRENAYVGSFQVTGGQLADRVTGTDGIAITSHALGPTFPEGLLVVHDQRNSGGDSSNYKFVSWRDVARSLSLTGSMHDELGGGAH